MKFGVTICNHGEYADPNLLADLAVDAEQAGWDGVFVWDHIARDGEPPMTDPWIALAAIATRTQRVKIGPMVTPLARRRPWKVARETVALDHLSNGRLILGVGLGIHPEEFERLGEEQTFKGRASLLDEALDVIVALWSGEPVDHHGQAFDVQAHFRPTPLQTPRIPIWVGGGWPNRAPFRRAARFDGSFPNAIDGSLQPTDYRDITDLISRHRVIETPFTLVHQGNGGPGDIDRWPQFAAVGVDWWLESFRSGERPVDEAKKAISDGPPVG